MPIITKSVVHNLRSRETFGTKARNSRQYPWNTLPKMFTSIPARLVFSLQDIVDGHVLLEQAHVFLGFNSDGTFVISYTESFEASEPTGLPSYIYRLHWWLFQLDKKMTKVKSVRLFANEEILSSLQLFYAEWPHEKSKVILYGCSKGSDNCYITVSAVPSKEACKVCTESKSLGGKQKISCLKHGFAAHMKNTSVSSLSSVLHSSGLQIDNVIILNMGHSIGVISLGLLNSDSNTEMLPLSSIKRAAYEDKPDIRETDESCSIDKSIDYLLSPRLNLTNLNAVLQTAPDNAHNPLLSSEIFSHVSNFSEPFRLNSDSSQETYTNTQSTLSTDSDSLVSSTPSEILYAPYLTVGENCNSAIQYNDINKMDSKSSLQLPPYYGQQQIDPYFDPEPKSIVLLPRVENTSTDCDSDAFSSVSTGNIVQQSNVKCYSQSDESSENCCCNFDAAAKCSEHDSLHSAVRSFRDDKLRDKFDSNSSSSGKSKHIDCAAMVPSNMQSAGKAIKKRCSYCGLNICETNKTPETLKAKKKELHVGAVVNRSSRINSPGRNPSTFLIYSSLRNSKELHQDCLLELNAPTPSPSASESSGSIYCAGDSVSQTSHKSGSCRRTDGIISFYETMYEHPRSGSEGSHEDAMPAPENSLFYDPVAFESTNGLPLIPVKLDCTSVPVAYSQHLVLDVEHVIFDVLRTRCYTTYKFGYLIDYDVQIIDTCASNRSVVILIAALLNVSPRKGKAKSLEQRHRFNGIFEPTTSKSQQFQFFINWQLQTGRYEVVAASPLHVLSAKMSGKWDASWVLDTRNAIRKTCAIPLSHHCNVYVLNNAAVFRGKSLSYLWNADRIIALRK